jgi:hypothetical protein
VLYQNYWLKMSEGLSFKSKNLSHETAIFKKRIKKQTF